MHTKRISGLRTGDIITHGDSAARLTETTYGGWRAEPCEPPCSGWWTPVNVGDMLADGQTPYEDVYRYVIVSVAPLRLRLATAA